MFICLFFFLNIWFFLNVDGKQFIMRKKKFKMKFLMQVYLFVLFKYCLGLSPFGKHEIIPIKSSAFFTRPMWFCSEKGSFSLVFWENIAVNYLPLKSFTREAFSKRFVKAHFRQFVLNIFFIFFLKKEQTNKPALGISS